MFVFVTNIRQMCYKIVANIADNCDKRTRLKHCKIREIAKKVLSRCSKKFVTNLDYKCDKITTQCVVKRKRNVQFIALKTGQMKK